MHGAHAAPLEPAFHAEVEVRCVDADEDVGSPVEHAPAERLAQFQQARQVGQHFGQAHHRQFVGIEPGVEAGGAHAVAADPGEFRMRETLAQFLDQSGAELVAGGFAGAERNTPGDSRHAAYLSSGRSPRSMKSSISRTSSLPVAISPSSALASSSLASPMYRAR